LYRGVGVSGDECKLQREGCSLEGGKRDGEMVGSIRIRALVLLKSCSLPSLTGVRTRIGFRSSPSRNSKVRDTGRFEAFIPRAREVR